MKYKTLIIDDNDMARAALKDDLKAFDNIEVIGEANSVEQGVATIIQTKPALIFLDIRMGDGTGFDLLEKLKGIWKGHVIFTTAYNEYAIKAFKYSALDYLLKPVDSDELSVALQKLPEDLASNNMETQLQLLLEQLKPKHEALKRLALNSVEKVVIVSVDEIVHCESQKNYTIFYLKDLRQILVTKTLKEYEELLEPEGFLRVHHSHLINLNYLKEFVKTDGGYAVMKDGKQIPVSVRKKEQLMKMLGL